MICMPLTSNRATFAAKFPEKRRGFIAALEMGVVIPPIIDSSSMRHSVSNLTGCAGHRFIRQRTRLLAHQPAHRPCGAVRAPPCSLMATAMSTRVEDARGDVLSTVRARHQRCDVLAAAIFMAWSP
jgi:hypothetical protein